MICSQEVSLRAVYRKIMLDVERFHQTVTVHENCYSRFLGY